MTSSPPYSLRQAGSADAHSISDLIRRTIAQSYATAYSPAGVAFFQSLYTPEAVEARRQRGTVVFIEREGVPLATGALDEDRIFGLFVDPAAQGMGLGRAIMTALEARARAQGLSRVALYVSVPAYAFYEALGYTIGEELSTALEGGGSVRFWDAHKELPAR